jgi:DNA-binding MarR family transcriptional regulator
MEPTTYAALKSMERLGYIVRRRMNGDRKKAHVFLTPKGRALRNRLVPLAEAVNSVAIQGVRAVDVDTTRRVLLTIIANLAQDEQASDKPMPSTRALAQLQSRRRPRRRRA